MILRRKLAFMTCEPGFSLIEVVTTLVVLAMFFTMAVANFAAVRAKASDATARLNAATALEAAYSYYADRGRFTGLTLARLRAIDRGLASTNVAVVFARATTVCVSSTIGGRTWYRVYPGGDFTRTRCR